MGFLVSSIFALAYYAFAEIDQETAIYASGGQVVDKLDLMFRQNGLDGFEFDQQNIIHQQIRHKFSYNDAIVLADLALEALATRLEGRPFAVEIDGGEVGGSSRLSILVSAAFQNEQGDFTPVRARVSATLDGGHTACCASTRLPVASLWCCC